MNLVSLNPPGHFLVLKAYKVAEIMRRKGKKRPVIKLEIKYYEIQLNMKQIVLYLVSTPEQTRILMFDWKMCLVEAGSTISQQTFTPTSTMVRRREMSTLAAGLVQAG